MEKVRILVVEDERIVARDIVTSLEALGYEVCASVSSGDEAVEKAEKMRPHLVLMDIRLKGEMDGVEAADQIQARLNIPVVFLTAYADERTLRRAKITGPYGYLLKPFEEKELHSTIEVALYRHEMERKLRKQAVEWETTFNSIQDFISVHDSNFKLIKVNKAFAEAFGRNGEELLGKTCYQVIHGTQKPFPSCPYLHALESKQAHKEEFFEPRLGIHLEVSVSPIFDDKGENTETVHITKDISIRKRAEEALRESEKAAQKLSQENAVMAEIGRIISSTLNIKEVYERFAAEARKLIPFDRIVVSLHNPEETTATVAYASGLELGGRKVGDVYPLPHTSNEEVIRTRAGLLVQVEAVEELEGGFSGLIAAFRAGLRSIITVPLIFRDRVIGVLRLASEKLKAYADRDLRLAERIANQIAGAIGNAQLFLERKQAEQKIQRSRTMLQTIFDGIAEPMFMVDENYAVKMLNIAAKNYFQVDFNEAVGKSFYQLLGREGPCDSYDIHSLIKKGRVYSFEREGGKDPNQIENVTVFPLREEESAIIRITDITKAKLLQNKLIQSEKMASLGLLISGVAHEINNPNNFITFNIPILRDYLSKIVPITDEYAKGHPSWELFNMSYSEFRQDLFRLLQNIEHGADRISHTISRLREFSKMKDRQRLDRVILKEVVERAVDICQSEIKKMVKSFEVKIPDEAQQIFTDPKALEQVIINILINAVDAVVDKENSQIRLTVNKEKLKKGILVIEISDNGSGMDKETLIKIFNPFFTTKKTGKGTGLGLYISHDLIEGLRGSIEVKSKLGKGSTFRIILPIEAE